MSIYFQTLLSLTSRFYLFTNQNHDQEHFALSKSTFKVLSKSTFKVKLPGHLYKTQHSLGTYLTKLFCMEMKR